MIARKPKVKRSSKWPALSKRFLKGKVCAVCGAKDKLVAHHVAPVHIVPERELDETNLLPLCEGRGTVNCHIWCGHLGSWPSYNVSAVHDADYFSKKIKERP